MTASAHASVKKGIEKRRQARPISGRIFPYLLILPTVLVVALVVLYPVMQAVGMSAFSYRLLGGRQLVHFTGLANYQKLLVSNNFWHSLWITLIYTAGTVAGSYAIGLGTALVLNEKFCGRSVARLLVLLPWPIPLVAASLLWMWMYDYQYGVINYLTGLHTNWLGQPSMAMLAVLLPSIWQQYPVATVMLLAGLLAIPNELYNAAAVDGANRWQRFRYVTLPGLRPVTVVIVLLLTIWSFKKFDFIYIMTEGGPAKATETLILQTYLQAFKSWQLGYASALGTVSLLISLFFTITYLAVLRKNEE